MALPLTYTVLKINKTIQPDQYGDKKAIFRKSHTKG